MPVIRVLDANINRAAEGMRVLEDIARFVLEDKRLCSEVKSCRHELREQTPTLYSRSTAEDVGTGISTVQEGNRGSIHDIALAASNRCSEALRVVEEFLKLHNAENTVESIRYRMYDLSAEIIKQLGSTNKHQWKLCFIMAKDDCVMPWKETLSIALDAGCDCVQIREKTMSTYDCVEHVREVQKITNAYGVPIIINDRVDVMLATNAGGVHLGADDLPLSEARRICGKEKIIGATAHSIAELNNAINLGVDYVGVGAMFPSPTKPNVAPAETGLLEAATSVHHLAVGGITPDNVHLLHNRGCQGVAVSSVIANSTTPGLVVETLLQPKAQPA